jgi:protein-disulfide isomerase
LPQIKRDYIDTGKIKYLFFDFPLESIHKNALKAAEASRCAADQGKYWEMHDQLFANSTALEMADLARYATVLNLDPIKFQECLESGKYTNEIRGDISEGNKASVRGTPTCFIGVSEGENTRIQVLRVIRGAKPYIEFKEVFDSLLSSQK